jgi:hypothetical protein
LKFNKEVVCMAVSDSLLAVGSQSHVSLVDPRKKSPIQDVESLDAGHGARWPRPGMFAPEPAGSSMCTNL